jgi:hypothetical protein
MYDNHNPADHGVCETCDFTLDACTCEHEVDDLRFEQLMDDAYTVGTHPELDMGTLMQVVEDIMHMEVN